MHRAADPPGAETLMKSAVFVVVDVKAQAVVLVFVLFEEDVFFVIGQLFVDLDILDVWNILFATFLGVGVFKADDFRRCRIGNVFHFLDLVFVVGLAGNHGCGLAGQQLLEIGAGIGLARIGRDNRVEVQIVELLARIGIGPLGAAVRGGHFSCLVE